MRNYNMDVEFLSQGCECRLFFKRTRRRFSKDFFLSCWEINKHYEMIEKVSHLPEFWNYCYLHSTSKNLEIKIVLSNRYLANFSPLSNKTYQCHINSKNLAVGREIACERYEWLKNHASIWVCWSPSACYSFQNTIPFLLSFLFHTLLWQYSTCKICPFFDQKIQKSRRILQSRLIKPFAINPSRKNEGSGPKT